MPRVVGLPRHLLIPVLAADGLVVSSTKLRENVIDFQNSSQRFSVPTRQSDSKISSRDEDRVPGLMTAWALIRRRLHVILFCGLLTTVAAGLYCYLAPAVFMSDTAILVIKKNPSLPLPRTDVKQEVDPAVGDDLLATHMLILSSPKVVEDALRKHELDNLPSILGALDKNETPTEYVTENLRVTRGGEGQGRSAHILNVQFRHRTADDCAVVLQSVVASYRDFIKETFQGGIGEAASFIERARNDLEQELTSIDAEYQAFRERTTVIRKNGETVNVHVTNMEQYTSALAEVRLQRTEVESRLKAVRPAYENRANLSESDLKKLPLIDEKHIERMLLMLKVHQGEHNSPATNASLAQIGAKSRIEHDRLVELLMNETELISKGFGRDHPKLKKVRQSIDRANELIAAKTAHLEQLTESSRLEPAKIVEAYYRLLHSELADLKRREYRLDALLKHERKKAKTFVADELTEEKLRGRKDRTQQLYDAVVRRLDEVNLAKDYAGFVTSVVSPVEVGEQVSPKPVLCLPLGVFLGLCLGAALAVFMDLTQRTFFSAEDVRWTLKLPVLGHVPQFGKNGNAVACTRDGTLDPTLVSHNRPASAEAEVFRSLRMPLYQNGHDLKVVQVTSPTPGDGKSTLAANLAISLAQGGNKVLLLDADLHQPKLATLFALPSTAGLSSLLANQAELRDVAQPTNIPNLHVIPAGPRPTPGQFNRHSFGDLLDQIRDRYDHIIVDSPAVLATSDTVEIAAAVDGILFMLNAEQNSDWATKAKDILSSVSQNVIGVVVNVYSGRRRWGGRYDAGGYEYARTTPMRNDRFHDLRASVEVPV